MVELESFFSHRGARSSMTYCERGLITIRARTESLILMFTRNLSVCVNTDKVAWKSFFFLCHISASSIQKVIGMYGETLKVPRNNGDNKPAELMFTKWKHVSLCCSSCLNLSVLDHCPAVMCQENQPHWWSAKRWISALHRPAIFTVTLTKEPPNFFPPHLVR